MSFLTSLYSGFFERIEQWFKPIVMLGLRVQIAYVFILSGLAKWSGFLKPDPGVYDLFMYEFFCPEEPRAGALQLCNPETLEYVDGSTTVTVIKYLAVTAGVMEVVLPVLLIIGLLSRFAALGIVAMVAFIQLAVFPEWSHWMNPASWWFAVAAAIVVAGPGKLSLDYWLGLERKA